MSNKTKYLLSLITVLIIGIFLGFLINGRLVRERVNRLQESFTEKGFRYEFMHSLKPTPQQMKNIQPILKIYGLKNRENIIQYRIRQQELFHHLQNDLLPYLNKNQIKKLNNMRNRWDKRFRRPDWFQNQRNRRMEFMRPGRRNMPMPPPESLHP